jgi:hypothetical protein
MKKILLLFVFTCAIMAQTVTISMKPLDFPGLRVASATDPSVQGFVTSVLDGMDAPEVTNLLPYSLVLDNNTPQTIRAYTIRLAFVDANGQSGGSDRQYFNFESTSNGMEIPAGSSRLVSPLRSLAINHRTSVSIAGASTPSKANALVNRLRSQVAVVVSMDLVVFDSGQVIGPDEGNTLSYLNGYLMGEREAASLVHTALTRGLSVEKVSAQLNRLLTSIGDPQPREFDKLARASQVKRLLMYSSSKERLLTEVSRILRKQSVTLYRQ